MNATSHCTGNKLIFESLISRDGRLITIGGFLRITERGIAKIVLLNSFRVKLTNVLMMLNIGINLLSTQALLIYRIENH